MRATKVKGAIEGVSFPDINEYQSERPLPRTRLRK